MQGHQHNMLTQHYLSFLVKFLGDNIFAMLQSPSDVSRKLQSSMTILHQSCWQEKFVGFWQINELIHHPWQYLFTKNYHCDIKYHMTLNILNTHKFHVILPSTNRNTQIWSALLPPYSVPFCKWTQQKEGGGSLHRPKSYVFERGCYDWLGIKISKTHRNHQGQVAYSILIILIMEGNVQFYLNQVQFSELVCF